MEARKQNFGELHGLDRINEFSLNLKRISNFLGDVSWIKELHERLEKIKQTNFEYMWLQSLSIPAFSKLMRIYEELGNEGVEQFLLMTFRSEKDIATFEEMFSNNPVYQGRKQIIKDCLQAHIQGKYTLSIPVLLAQCDGIVIEKVRERNPGLDNNGINLGNAYQKKRLEMDESLGRLMRRIYWTDVTNRQGILHGWDADYYKNNGELLSVKLIWLLFETIHI